MLRDVKGSSVSGAIADGFSRNSKAAMPQLQSRLDQLAKMIPDVSEGETIELTWIPDKGTQVIVRGTTAGTVDRAGLCGRSLRRVARPRPGSGGPEARASRKLFLGGVSSLQEAGALEGVRHFRVQRSNPTPTNISFVQNHIAGETRSTPPASVVTTAARMPSGRSAGS